MLEISSMRVKRAFPLLQIFAIGVRAADLKRYRLSFMESARDCTFLLNERKKVKGDQAQWQANSFAGRTPGSAAASIISQLHHKVTETAF
ncbi:MAG: hypothetical protein WKF92_07490 [Pyrinomonadaceae bacterium]